MTDANRAFRDYATRVSFNLTLSRNQIANLRNIVFETECLTESMTLDQRIRTVNESGAGAGSNFIVGRRSLESMGLIAEHPRNAVERVKVEEARKRGSPYQHKYWGPTCVLTPAGEHVVELLRIAGLMPRYSAVNENERSRKRRKA